MLVASRAWLPLRRRKQGPYSNRGTSGEPPAKTNKTNKTQDQEDQEDREYREVQEICKWWYVVEWMIIRKYVQVMPWI